MTSTTDQRTERLAALRHSAYRIRRNALDMGEVQGQGYVGQALGVADVLAVAYMDQLRYRADDPHWEGRDRFLLSIGHYAIPLYAALAEAGFAEDPRLRGAGHKIASSISQFLRSPVAEKPFVKSGKVLALHPEAHLSPDERRALIDGIRWR